MSEGDISEFQPKAMSKLHEEIMQYICIKKKVKFPMNKGEIKQNKGKKGKNEDRTAYKEKY